MPSIPNTGIPNTNSPGSTIGASGSTTGTASTVASQAKAKASELGQMARDKIDEKRGAAAGGLDSAAQTLHEKADGLPGGERVSSAAHTAADALSSTANYIRENDVRSMMEDMKTLVKNNPGPALLTAAVLGFLVARSFSRD